MERENGLRGDEWWEDWTEEQWNSNQIRKDTLYFEHFDTVEECDQFVNFVIQQELVISHRCCSQKGCAVFRKEGILWSTLQQQFKDFQCLQRPPLEVMCVGPCDICYEERELVCCCVQCHHPFCLSCLRRIESRLCPYCRTVMSFL